MDPARRPPAPPAAVHRLKVTLAGIRPPIWRRLLVSSDVTLARLHRILQAAMGWQDRHLHRFRVGAAISGDRGLLGEVSARGERTARLIEVASAPADRLRYEYDFGDRWEHDVVVEAVLPPATDATSTISWVVLNDGLVSSPAWVINRVLVSRRHACAVPNSHASPMPTQSSAPARGMH